MQESGFWKDLMDATPHAPSGLARACAIAHPDRGVRIQVPINVPRNLADESVETP